MAFNPFKSKPPVEKPNRNAFDLSFANNLTMEFGKLYPVFVKECIPGDTFRIQPTFSFRFMPMYFPVQSRMRADLKFFYVRNRNLWENWKKFIGQTDRISGKSVVPPYLDINASQYHRLATGSLLDYLGVPTTAPVLRDTTQHLTFDGYEPNENNEYNLMPNGAYLTHIKKLVTNQYAMRIFKDSTQDLSEPGTSMFDDEYSQIMMISSQKLDGAISDISDIKLTYLDKLDANGNSIFDAQYPTIPDNYEDEHFRGKKAGFLMIFQKGQAVRTHVTSNSYSSVSYDDLIFRYGCRVGFSSSNGEMVCEHADIGVSTINGESLYIKEFMNRIDFKEGDYYLVIALDYDESKHFQILSGNKTNQPVVLFPNSIEIKGIKQQVVEDVLTYENPFVNNKGDIKVKLSALPSRAYESIFNAFYRNIEVSPFRINETDPYQLPTASDAPEYDKFIPVSADGADSYPYDFHYVNWEHDFLTDALPSPQMGTAPLVGGRQAVENTKLYQISGSSLAINEQGSAPSGSSIKVGAYVTSDTINGGQIRKLLQLDPQSSSEDLQSALDSAVSYGISINDFRNVNALQKWLEKNVRRGYRYKDQILSHFGVDLTFEECDMPEYIGGISQDVDVRAISQSVETSTGALGSYAGQAGVAGRSREIDKYTDEHGFIMGILCITPIPTYSQLLPKHFTKQSPLDYFTPEFGHIGYQPIPLQEVAPLNIATSSVENKDSLYLKAFGYQRAWYDYLGSVDELHGEFRDTLDDYLVDRVFEGVPALSQEFIQVDPSQINDIFNYTGGDDKIVGQIWFDTTVVRPIPKFGVPRLD